MKSKQKEKYLAICQELINEAEPVIKSQFRTRTVTSPLYVDTLLLNRWWGKIKGFIHILGPIAKPWKEDFKSNPERNSLSFVLSKKGVLESIYYAIENDQITSIYQMLRAETLSDLYEQAEHLFKNGFFLASGVICRAVLEEHLRTICINLSCLPDKDKPTLNDFNQSLYKIEFYSKTKMKHIETLATIGNNAAHNRPELTKDDVKKILQDLPELIESTSVS